MKAVIYTRASLDATGRTKAGRRPTTLLGGGLARCGTCGGPGRAGREAPSGGKEEAGRVGPGAAAHG